MDCLSRLALFATILITTNTFGLDFEDYAASCKAELEGGDVIDFPEVLECVNGDIIPITQNGVPLDANTVADGNNFGPDVDCDHPPALALGDQGQCVPNSRLTIQRVEQANTQDNERPVFSLLCRNYKYRPSLLPNGNPNLNPKYDDIALIIYSPKNHNTCFFQRLSDTAALARGVTSINKKSITNKAVAAISGSNIPSPFVPQGAGFWASPTEMRDNLVCSNCHDANPFIRTPYIKQVRVQLDVWFPNRGRTTPYNIVELNWFGHAWKTNHARFDLAPLTAGNNGYCVRCHSIGPGYSSGLLTDLSTGDVTDNQLIPPGHHASWLATHWMPPNADQNTWDTNYGTSVQIIKDCHANPQGPDCNKTDLH